MTTRWTLEMRLPIPEGKGYQSWAPVAVTPDGSMETFNQEQALEALAHWKEELPETQFRLWVWEARLV